jgi:hypothetical protein
MDDNNNPNEYDEYGYKRLAMLVRDASTPPNKTIEAMKKFINETVNVAILCVSFLLIINLLAVNPRAEMRLIDEQYYHIPKSKTIMRQLPNFTTLYICTADTADTADERTNSPPPILTSAATQ